MIVRHHFIGCLLCSLLATLPTLAFGQIFTDTEFLEADYDSDSTNLADIRYNFDYSNFDVFGDGFLTASIPVAPRTTDGSTTGAFLSVNNDSTDPAAGAAAFAAIMPNSVNVGNGTANSNYVMRLDVFHSSGAGIDDGAGNIELNGTTNYAVVGLNQANTSVQMADLNAPGSGTLSGQGLRLGVTADSGAAEDYAPIYAGAFYRDRPGTVTAGQFYNGTPSGETGNSGLAGNQLNNYWLAQGLGFELADTDSDPANDLNIFTGDSLYFSPDPTDTGGFLADGSGVDRSVYAENFPLTSDPIHYDGGGVTPPEFLMDTDDGAIAQGIPTNAWATHEVYWVDDQFTYVIDGTPVLQITPDSNNVFDAFSTAGAPILAFWDRFSSIASSPEGANFVIYDNLELETADSSDVPDMMAFLDSEGFLLSGPGQDGDFDGDGDVDGADFLAWQRGDSPDPLSAGDLATWEANFGTTPAPATAAVAVPEPTSAALMLSLAAVGLLQRSRRENC